MSFTQTDFQNYLQKGQLVGAKCTSCGSILVPPRPMCPECYGDTEAVELSGKGELAAYTAVFIGPTAMINAGYDRTKPYCTGVVKLAEGPMISAQILGVPAEKPEQIAIGTPLAVTFIERGDDENKKTFLAFQTI